MIERLGVLGGMFDPVHKGHVQAANIAFSRLSLDQLNLVPCHVPNHRAGAKAAAEHRIKMLELATARHPQLTVDNSEIEKTTVSYTVDTLIQYREKAIANSLVFVMGIDSFNSLPDWDRWQQILELCHLLVLNRPGCEISAEVSAAIDLPARLCTDSESLFETNQGGIMIVDEFDCDISSTMVRRGINSGSDLSALLAKEIITYIQENNLYSNENEYKQGSMV